MSTLTMDSRKRYRFFNRCRTRRDLHRYYDMCMVFWWRGLMTDRELSLHAEWVCEQKDKLSGKAVEDPGA